MTSFIGTTASHMPPPQTRNDEKKPADPDFITKLVIIETSAVLAGQVLSAATKHEQSFWNIS